MAGFVYLRNVATLALDGNRCNGCGMCLTVCARAVLVRRNGKVEIADRDRCIECGACLRNCPSLAMSVRTGVGCATAVINQMLGRKSACCVIEEGSGRPACC
jgi:ferredoxin